MKESKFLEKYLIEEPSPSQDRDAILQYKISELNGGPLANGLIACGANVGVLFLFIIFGLITKFPKDIADTVSDRPFAIAGSFVLLIFAVALIYSGFKMMKNDSLKRTKEIFYLLSEKPYEIRVNWEENKKMKVVVEGNLMQGQGHVFKEKSQHFTCYIDFTLGKKSVVKMITEIVKKAEETFK